jgi:hypothetical protein
MVAPAFPAEAITAASNRPALRRPRPEDSVIAGNATNAMSCGSWCGTMVEHI